MQYHSVRIHIKGTVTSSRVNDEQELDIADEFSRLSRSLGFEGEIDTYAGLWATGFAYDDYSLLTGDFLARGLHLDLVCDSTCRIPFGEMFLCLGETLRQIAQCEVTELAVICEPYSIATRNKREKTKAYPQQFFRFADNGYSLPSVRCSHIAFTIEDQRHIAGENGTVMLARSQYYLPELALPFSGIWAQWDDQFLRHTTTIRIAAKA